MDNNYKRYLRLFLSPQYFPPIITTLILLIGAIALLALVTDNNVTIEKNNIIARVEPATNAESIDTLNINQEYAVLDKQNGWLKIRVNARNTGWVPEWLIENEALTSDQSLAAHILIATPVYTLPDENSDKLTDLDPENYIIVLSEKLGWLQIELPNGQYGYIKTRAVNLINQSDIPSINPSDLSYRYDPEAIQKAKEEAEKIIVVRYASEPFLETPSFSGNTLYNVAYGQKFKYLDEVQDQYGTYFMHVEDSEGLQGYVESRISAFESDSIGHVTETFARSINEATIMIDPGHGGTDPGGVSDDGTVFENTIALSTSMLLKDKLEAAGATVLMTRTTDETVELLDRSTMSNEQQVDAFISIHYDRGRTPDWRGTTSYYFHEFDKALATEINNAISTTPLPNNGTLFGNFSVLRENTRPAVLLELGYMSSPEDLKYINTPEYQNEIATLISSAIVNYFGTE